MSKNSYDVIVVGARCAGSPTAMLLARQGYKVLVVDKATFPSDTISTHMIHPPGIAALKRWGLLDQVVATGCPPVTKYSFDFGPVTISGSPATPQAPVGYAPRRTVLDKILVDGASAAGAEVREGFTITDIVIEDGRVAGIRGHGRDGATVTERARVVVGADGRHSSVVKAVRPEQYNEKPQMVAGYYAYWSGLDNDGCFEVVNRPNRGWVSLPTNDGLTLVAGGWPFAEFDANKKDIEGNYLKAFEMAPEFAERIRHAKRESRFVGAAVPNYFRKPYGPGWALVGDAGYNKDFITAMGITDAFRDAELLSTALAESLSGARSFEVAMQEYQTTRDTTVMPIYELTAQIASFEPPPAEMQQLIGAMAGNQEAMDAFVRMNAATMSPIDFFAPEHIGRIMSAAGATAAAV